jgi:drug/metabolite transporter (DMT)-like permease
MTAHGREGSRSRRRVADSAKLALAAVLLTALASSGWLSRLHSEAMTTAAFLLYFIWPILSLVMFALTFLFTFRDARVGLRWQALAALGVMAAVVGFTLTHFHGWE